jgi:hypothetical protein
MHLRPAPSLILACCVSLPAASGGAYRNPLLDGAVIGPGHHCVVTGPDGKLWMIYHQKFDAGKSFRRFLALDRLWLDSEGNLRARTTRDSDETGPAQAN